MERNTSETYKINNSTVFSGTKCECGHTVAAHGSKGQICAACSCKQFVEEFNSKVAKGSKSIP